MTVLTIDKGWEFTHTPSKHFEDVQEEWRECSSFPTCVHVELHKAGKIPDPFRELNEWDVQWIGEADWSFRTTFVVDDIGTNADLVLEGVDTYCDVSLNGMVIGQTDNMFISHRLPCRAQLRVGRNELQLRFRSAWLEAKKRQHDNAGPSTCWNGDACRMYSRKAQYHWGWDWGPKLISVGPWRPIRIEMYDYRFVDVRVDADVVGSHFTMGTLKASASITPVSGKSLRYSLVCGDAVIKEEDVDLNSGVQWKLPDIEAWWPIGYGKQPLYQLKTCLLDENGAELASRTTKVAFRHVNVIQAPLDGHTGTSFYFEVNGVPIFCGGSNWIPADSFLTSITRERYRSWIRLMAEGNQNMLRIWGGGVYEDEALYDACDEFGILVWQDFMFACGLYPSYPAFNDSVKAEAEQVVRRLRNHPCVVLFAGNNEDYAVAEMTGVIDYSDESGHYEKTGFPARHIYEILLPKVVKDNSNIFYWRSSPYGGKSTADATVGDIHQWNVWHGSQEPWSNWDQLAGRFVSEFGMQGYPDSRTIAEWTDKKDQLYPQSRVSAQHNKATGFERRIETYLVENFQHTFDMPGYTYITQLMQAECLAAAYRVWRRNWKGRGKEYTAGALVWQLNDCWPCVSWAIADYYLRPKPAFFAISRELRPIVVSMTRKTTEKPVDDLTDNFIEIHDTVELWGCNSTLSARAVQVELQSWDLDHGLVDRRTFDASLLPNQSTEIWTGNVPGQPIRASRAESPRPIVLHAVVRDGQEIISRASNWPEPYKYLRLPDPSLQIDVKGEKVTLTCAIPTKGILLDVEGDAVEWSDQAIDLFPGDPQMITAKGLAGRDVKARYLQNV